MIQVRYSTSPSSVETARTADLKDNYLVDTLFVDGEVNGVYTHEDRLVIGGAVPTAGPLDLPAWDEVLGTSTHLQGRELGVINLGETGQVTVDGESYTLKHLDGLYVGRGSQVTFDGAGATFYFISALAHATYPTTYLDHQVVEPLQLGAPEGANERSLYRYVWGEDVKSAVLQFGVTVIAKGSAWNTMPPHLHGRRTEIYLYADLDENDRVFHFMGQPGSTRHLIVADKQAVISPAWSVHSGAGTGSYAFVWAMAGENNAYTDLFPVALEEL